MSMCSLNNRKNHSTFDNTNGKTSVDNEKLVTDFESRKKEDLDEKDEPVCWFGRVFSCLGCSVKK